MARVIKPPSPIDLPRRTPSVFLAGSIEMGAAEDWQAEMERHLADLRVVLLNPRRDDWSADWVQRRSDPRFRQQVSWELAALEAATVIAMYFAPETKAPVTLLELGLHARGGKLVVCCPDGFWRKGNVEMVCAHYRVPLVDTLTQLVEAVRQRVLHAEPTVEEIIQ
jgi:hypothetical protein